MTLSLSTASVLAFDCLLDGGVCAWMPLQSNAISLATAWRSQFFALMARRKTRASYTRALWC
jgi:hypothetical protein